MTPPVVRLEGIVRRFGSVTALDGAELELRAGEVHGVLGENGAGKTTLFGVLGGVVRPDSGDVRIDGHPVELRTAREAWAHGVGLVHQHFTLVPRLTVLENLALGRRSAARGWRLPLGQVRRRVTSLMGETGLSVSLEATVEELGVGDRQRIEILKALLREPRILVLDEPTAVLAPPEIGTLFTLLRRLARAGRTVVLVAHKLDEVLGVADRITVLRQGRTVLTASVDEVDAPGLAVAMVGGAREGSASTHEPAGAAGDVVARCVDVRVPVRGSASPELAASLEVRRGEIVGVAGVEGNGQSSLARLMSGRAVPVSGRVDLPERIGYIPQDRSLEGLALDFDLAENVALLLHRDATGPMLDWRAIRDVAEAIRVEHDVRAPDVGVAAAALSGGNQQRLVVGRELRAAGDLLVAENPTRGLDVAATDFVRRTLRGLVAAPDGPGVLLISTDLDEILALSDRVFALVRGELIPIDDEHPTLESVGSVMLRGAPAR